MRKYHRLGGLKNRHLLPALEAGNLRLRSGCGEALPGLLTLWRENRSNLSDVSYKGTNPIMRAPPSWPYLTLITTQRSCLLIPSLWGLGFQHGDLVVVVGWVGTHTHSVHDSGWYATIFRFPRGQGAVVTPGHFPREGKGSLLILYWALSQCLMWLD